MSSRSRSAPWFRAPPLTMGDLARAAKIQFAEYDLSLPETPLQEMLARAEQRYFDWMMAQWRGPICVAEIVDGRVVTGTAQALPSGGILWEHYREGGTVAAERVLAPAPLDEMYTAQLNAAIQRLKALTWETFFEHFKEED